MSRGLSKNSKRSTADRAHLNPKDLARKYFLVSSAEAPGPPTQARLPGVPVGVARRF